MKEFLFFLAFMFILRHYSQYTVWFRGNIVLFRTYFVAISVIRFALHSACNKITIQIIPPKRKDEEKSQMFRCGVLLNSDYKSLLLFFGKSDHNVISCMHFVYSHWVAYMHIFRWIRYSENSCNRFDDLNASQHVQPALIVISMFSSFLFFFEINIFVDLLQNERKNHQTFIQKTATKWTPLRCNQIRSGQRCHLIAINHSTLE